jgi:hypothetical protein
MTMMFGHASASITDAITDLEDQPRERCVPECRGPLAHPRGRKLSASSPRLRLTSQHTSGR